MATAALRNDVYLSILAGKALTALADLSADSSAWSGLIQQELESGIEYCEALREYAPVAVTGGGAEHQPLRHLATHGDEEYVSARLAPDIDSIEAFLRELLSRSRRPEPAELLAAIKFFSRDVANSGS